MESENNIFSTYKDKIGPYSGEWIRVWRHEDIYTIHTYILLLIGSITQDVYLLGSSENFYHVIKYFFWLLETLNSEEIIRNFITQHTQNLVGLHNEHLQFTIIDMEEEDDNDVNGICFSFKIDLF